jgi:cleavage stimulation factor subunit 3
MIYTLLLRSIGYSEVASTAVKSFHPLSSVILDPEEESSNMPRPDFTQMIPFKPKAQAIPGDHPVPGMFANTNSCVTILEYINLRN